MSKGITKSNLHSFNDFGLVMIDRSIGYPKMNKIKESIAFCNSSYDFSNLYGGNTYEDRLLSYTFRLKGRNIEELNIKQMTVANWITNDKGHLFDDFFPGYYFIAECEGDLNFKEIDVNKRYGDLEINFIAYPFKISDDYEGNNLWDNFNFELDYLQDSSFIINDINTVNLYNRSATNITPTIVCSSNMQIIKNGVTYNLNTGTSKDYRLELNMGNNEMTIKGNGTVEFKFRAEVL